MKFDLAKQLHDIAAITRDPEETERLLRLGAMQALEAIRVSGGQFGGGSSEALRLMGTIGRYQMPEDAE